MKKYILISVFIIFISNLGNKANAQIQCTVSYPPDEVRTLNKGATVVDVNKLKTIRIIVHFPLRADGSGNFTENTDCYGVVNQYNGYWLAEKYIERCNYWLNNNQVMRQQLSYLPDIPVNNINIQFKLSGVFFHRNTTLFNSNSISIMDDYVDEHNRDVAINVFLYPNGWGNGATWHGYDVCWCNGTMKSYNDYLNHGNWGIDNGIVHVSTHEIGHCLNMEHAKRYPSGGCCTTDSEYCLDDCADTPTYLELLADGYSDPCIWSEEGSSNNIMDYSPFQAAWTPCQIEIVHTAIATRDELKICSLSADIVNVFTDIETKNVSYIGKYVSVPSGASIKVDNNKALFISAEEFEINGEFEVSKGSVLVVNTAINCE